MFQFRILTRFALLCILAPGTLWAATDKVALVIGNSAYESSGFLRNPVNDAEAMAEKLRALGFDIVEGYDLDLDGMNAVLDEFSDSVYNAEVALFFYAGHGISVDGVNYLIPTDARLDHPVKWKRSIVPLEDVVETLSYSIGPNLLFIDACRDNPMTDNLGQVMASSNRSVAMSRGLSRMEYDRHNGGTAIAFATSPGKVAQDGEGVHSPFTSALLNHIGAENESIANVMTKVNGEVRSATAGRQVPWINMSLTEPLMLNPVEVSASADDTARLAVIEPAAAASAPSSADLEIDLRFFETVEEMGDIDAYRLYLQEYPNGKFRVLALARIAQLEKEAVEAAAPVESTTAETTQVAAAAPTVTQPSVMPAVADNRTFGSALTSLPVTPAVLSAESSGVTEQTLKLDREASRDVQNRLNALGHNVGGADGMFGGMTRGGIQSWQTKTGLPATGHLNSLQYQMLVVASEPVLANYLASRPAQPAYSAGGGGTQYRQQPSANSNQVLGAAVAGFLAGTILRGKR